MQYQHMAECFNCTASYEKIAQGVCLPDMGLITIVTEIIDYGYNYIVIVIEISWTGVIVIVIVIVISGICVIIPLVTEVES